MNCIQVIYNYSYIVMSTWGQGERVAVAVFCSC